MPQHHQRNMGLDKLKEPRVQMQVVGATCASEKGRTQPRSYELFASDKVEYLRERLKISVRCCKAWMVIHATFEYAFLHEIHAILFLFQHRGAGQRFLILTQAARWRGRLILS